MTGIAAGGLLATPSYAAVKNWVSLISDTWKTGQAWLPQGRPVSSDDAKHTTKQNHIVVDQDEACNTFEGDGGSVNDRFLLIESGNTLTVDDDIFGAAGSARFPIQMEDGTAGNATTLIVQANDVTTAASNLDIGPKLSFGQNAGFVPLDITGEVTLRL